MEKHEETFYYYGCLMENNVCTTRVVAVLLLTGTLKNIYEFKIYFANKGPKIWEKTGIINNEIGISNLNDKAKFDYKIFLASLCNVSFTSCYYKESFNAYELYEIKHEVKNNYLINKILFRFRILIMEERDYLYSWFFNKPKFIEKRITFETLQDFYYSLLLNVRFIDADERIRMENLLFKDVLLSPDLFFRDMFGEIAIKHYRCKLLGFKKRTHLKPIIDYIFDLGSKTVSILHDIFSCQGSDQYEITECVNKKLPELIVFMSNELINFYRIPIIESSDRTTNPLTDYFKMVLFNHEMQKIVYANVGNKRSIFNPLMISVECFINEYFLNDRFKNSFEGYLLADKVRMESFTKIFVDYLIIDDKGSYKITNDHVDYLLNNDNTEYYSLRLISNLEDFYEYVDFYLYLKVRHILKGKWIDFRETGTTNVKQDSGNKPETVTAKNKGDFNKKSETAIVKGNQIDKSDKGKGKSDNGSKPGSTTTKGDKDRKPGTAKGKGNLVINLGSATTNDDNSETTKGKRSTIQPATGRGSKPGPVKGKEVVKPGSATHRGNLPDVTEIKREAGVKTKY
jgi:hypothetical protein